MAIPVLTPTTPAWRQALRALRHGPDRLRHARRRAALLAEMRVWRPQRVVLVCHGNICRSPFAERWLVRAGLPAAGIPVLSAGFTGGGRRSPPAARVASRSYGVDLSAHRSQVLSGLLLEPGDLVVVMEPVQLRILARRLLADVRIILLGDLDPEPIATRAIPDPVDRGLADFEACYGRMVRCLVTLAQACLASADGGDHAGAGATHPQAAEH